MISSVSEKTLARSAEVMPNGFPCRGKSAWLFTSSNADRSRQSFLTQFDPSEVVVLIIRVGFHRLHHRFDCAEAVKASRMWNPHGLTKISKRQLCRRTANDSTHERASMTEGRAPRRVANIGISI